MKFITFLAASFLAALTAFAEDPATFPVGGFTFTRPTDWSWVQPTSSMRKAQLKVKGADETSSAEVVFFFFGENSGDVQANTKRWLGQFQSKSDAEKIDHLTVGATKITIVSTEGTYNSGMPGGPTTPVAEAALLGAILENTGGSVFVKMTGPAATVQPKRAQFLEMVNNAAKTLK